MTFVGAAASPATRRVRGPNRSCEGLARGAPGRAAAADSTPSAIAAGVVGGVDVERDRRLELREHVNGRWIGKGLRGAALHADAQKKWNRDAFLAPQHPARGAKARNRHRLDHARAAQMVGLPSRNHEVAAPLAAGAREMNRVGRSVHGVTVREAVPRGALRQFRRQTRAPRKDREVVARRAPSPSRELVRYFFMHAEPAAPPPTQMKPAGHRPAFASPG